MKNKHKIVVSLAVLITLALLTLTGCVSIKTTYDLSKIDIATISDATEDVLSSCVAVDVKSRFSGSYSCVGIAVASDKILVPSQAVGKGDYFTYTGRVYGSNVKIDLIVDTTMGEELGVSILSVVTEGVRLIPVEFGDSDNLAMGEMLLGITYDAPIIGDEVEKSEVTADYLLAMSVMVSSKYMNKGTHPFTGLTDTMEDSSFMTYGYFNSSQPNYKNSLSGSESSGLGNETYLNLTNCWLFNLKGKFVGVNYLRFVDETTDFNNVVLGIGYASKSNSIKQYMPTFD